MSTQEISLRSIQHYLYCPHRWGLLEIDRAWAENYFVTKANLLHKRVHEPDRTYHRRGKQVFTSVMVYNDQEEYNLYGVTDCIETSDHVKDVVSAKDLCIVEYKPTMPKVKEYNEDDLMQVFAQKICVDYIFRGDCKGVLYYSDKKKRVELPLRENYAEYDARLRKLLQTMREYLKMGYIPPLVKSAKCNGCSMKDICMPKNGTTASVRTQIQKLGKEEL